MKWCEKKTYTQYLYVSFHRDLFIFTTGRSSQNKSETSDETVQK